MTSNIGKGETKLFGDASDCSCATIKIDFTFDKYPGDVSWELFNTCSGKVEVASGKNYSGPSSSETFYVQDGEFELKIMDSYGDGICCQAGEGSYSVYKNDVLMVSMAPGTSYGAEVIETFGSANNCA